MACEHFKFIREFDAGEGVEHRTTQEFSEDCLPEVISCIEHFLRGCGFYFKGHLVIDSRDEEAIPTEEDK